MFSLYFEPSSYNDLRLDCSIVRVLFKVEAFTEYRDGKILVGRMTEMEYRHNGMLQVICSNKAFYESWRYVQETRDIHDQVRRFFYWFESMSTRYQVLFVRRILGLGGRTAGMVANHILLFDKGGAGAALDQGVKSLDEDFEFFTGPTWGIKWRVE